MNAIDGIEIHSSPFVPETHRQALDDAEERFAAMTAHHIDLSLLDLTREEPCVVFYDGFLFVHPNNLAKLRAFEALT